MKFKQLTFACILCVLVCCFYTVAALYSRHLSEKNIPSGNVKPLHHAIAQKKHSIKKINGNHSLARAANTAFASCTEINWATWSNFLGTSAIGTIINEKGEKIKVTMTANYSFGTTSTIYNYEAFGGFYSQIPNTNVPRTTWAAGSGGITTMCFSDTVTNPVLMVASLGDTSITARIDFSLPYVLLYDGGGMVYNNNTAMTGKEGYAVVMFPGQFTCVTINSSTPEIYTNITWGLSPLPFPVSVAENGKTCGSDTLTALGGVSYLWSDGDTPNSATNTFHKSGTYIVSVTNTGGCVAVTSKTITVGNAVPPVVLGDTTGCESVTLNASGGVSYLWSGGDTPANPSNTFHKSGVYTVAVTDVSGCTASVSKTVVIGPPKPVISGNVTGCDTVTLTASGGVSYLWDGGDSPTSATNHFISGGTYHITVTDANGCTGTSPVVVTIKPDVTPSVTITANPPGPICIGTPVSFTASVLNGGESPDHQWLKNNVAVSTGPTYTATNLANNDTIVCRLTSSAMCAVPPVVVSNTIYVTVNEIPIIKRGQNFVISGTEPIQLKPVITGDVKTYLWSPALGLSDPTIKNPLANPAYAINYLLTVTSPAGCQDTATVKVSIHRSIGVPNTFTPNGDGVNDTWNITNLLLYPNASIKVYNRWGQPVFNSIGYSKAWDGTYNGAPLPVGTYYYVIDLKDNAFKLNSGWVAILR